LGKYIPFLWKLILVTTRLAKIFRAVADAIKAEAVAKGDLPMEEAKITNGLEIF
jgi:hypothetical protein